MENRRKTIGVGPSIGPSLGPIEPTGPVEPVILTEETTYEITDISEPQIRAPQQVEQRKKGKKAPKRGESAKNPQSTQKKSAGSNQKADYMAEGITLRYGRRIRQTERAKR